MSRYTLALVLCFGAIDAMAVEEAKYTVLVNSDPFEVRDYAPQIVAEVIINDSFENAGGEAFSRLFRYISGDNKARTKLSMTTPVAQTPESVKIDMTAPVGQQAAEQGWAVSFVMPAKYTVDTLPVPDDPSIRLREVPERRMAAVSYSGFWSEKSYLKHKSELLEWIEKNDYRATGEPLWARYNPPFMPWFLRRNEILIPVASPSNGTD